MNGFKTFFTFVFLMIVFPAAMVSAHGPNQNHQGNHGPHNNKCQWEAFGETAKVIELTSDCAVYPDCLSDGSFTYSGVSFIYTGSSFKKKFGYLKFQDINQLSTDYNVTNTDCGGGSPRFSIELPNVEGTLCSIPGDSCSIFVYIGPYPNFTDCAAGWQTTGNLIGNADLRFDTSQLTGGTFYDSYSNALALAGPVKVLGIDLVVDGGWTNPGGGQDILVNNVMVNNFTLNANGSGGLCEHD
jgi:hypothetical protein